MSEQIQAKVREIDGHLVLDSPMGLAMARAVEKHNCRQVVDAQRERMEHFKTIISTSYNPEEVVIVLANVDDANGRILADNLMPDHDWQQYRDRGEVPFARGLAGRLGIQAFVDATDKDEGNKLLAINGIAIVVVDRGVAAVFEG